MPMPTADALAQSLERLIDARRADDGAWSALSYSAPDAESTAWALLAYRALDRLEGEAFAASREYLRATQHASGAWGAASDADGAWWPTAVVALCLPPTWLDPGVHARALASVVEQENRRLPFLTRLQLRLEAARGATRVMSHDAEIPGWSWHRDTAAWVEPTAMGVLALTTASSPPAGAAPRIRDGVALLVDRQAPDGGWNYGNVRVLDYDLDSFPDTTGWALLALASARDRVTGSARDGLEAAAARGVTPLAERVLGAEPSPLSLALTWHVLRAWSPNASLASQVRERLIELLPDAIDATGAGYPLIDTRTASLGVCVMADRPLLEVVRA